MKSFSFRCANMVGVVAALTLGVATPTWAAPVSSHAAGLNTAVHSDVTQVRARGRAPVRHYRGNRGNGAAAAAVLGIVGTAAAIAAANANRDRYYGGYGYQPAPAYGYGYQPAPAYGYGYQRPYYRGYASCPYGYSVQDGVCKPYRGY